MVAEKERFELSRRLNPTYTLSRGASSANLSTSPDGSEPNIQFVQKINGGESGIRTHAPLRTNGFQDRLVMTTSIPLQVYICFALFVERKNDSSKDSYFCQQLFLHFLYFLFWSFFYANSCPLSA